MNKFRLLAIALVLGTTSLLANTIINPEVSRDEIRKQIVELVGNSKVSIDDITTVNVTFTFSSEGEIVVLKVDSKDEQVLSFVRENLNSKKLEKPARANRYFTMPISIK